jgi:hypothetical protein
MEYGDTPYAHHNYLSGSSVEAIEFDFSRSFRADSYSVEILESALANSEV